ncbi:hypothetical protein LMG28140_06148 [Paraburkholderia metrosideri]|uniref:Uncharacterized protein n=1 Tax=Paraburkholderia metrosideri TaxID=580937 RepID=A0ABN7IEX8_9BURK|nr:hypothetical protein LMG28140_06148 [Paraburkholderia metrosideri]
MPAVGGGPSPEKWNKMSKSEKIFYWIFVGLAVAVVGYLVIAKIWGRY